MHLLPIHESWREEIGWILVLFGVAGAIFEVLNLALGTGLPRESSVACTLLAIALAVCLVGLALHFTRRGRNPKKPADDDEHMTT